MLPETQHSRKESIFQLTEDKDAQNKYWPTAAQSQGEAVTGL